MLVTSFKHSCFPCCSMLSFGVSTTSPKNLLSFNMSPTQAINFIRYRNRHHIQNNIRYKGSISNTSVTIFLNKDKKTPSDSTFARENLQWGFCDVSCSFIFLSSFCCCCSFVIVLHLFPGFTMSPALHPGFSDLWRPPPTLSSSSPTTYGCIFFFTYRQRYGFEWAFFTHKRFLPYVPSLIFYLHLSRPPWEPVALPWSLQGFMLILETQTRPTYLFDSQQFTIFIFRRIHQTLSWITFGESLIYMLLKRFELFSLV